MLGHATTSNASPVSVKACFAVTRGPTHVWIYLRTQVNWHIYEWYTTRDKENTTPSCAQSVTSSTLPNIVAAIALVCAKLLMSEGIFLWEGIFGLPVHMRQMQQGKAFVRVHLQMPGRETRKRNFFVSRMAELLLKRKDCFPALRKQVEEIVLLLDVHANRYIVAKCMHVNIGWQQLYASVFYFISWATMQWHVMMQQTQR